MIQIGNRYISDQHYPFIIAEMSGNHNQSLEKALRIVDKAAEVGADAIKLQTYTSDTLTLNIDHGDFRITDPNSLWNGRSLYELYQEAFTPWEWHEAIFAYAKQRGIICFSTAFDDTAVDFLEKLDCPLYKIASFENNHLQLLAKVARTRKPVIMSTGVTTLGDLNESVDVLRRNGCKDLVLLKCTSSYPASPESSNVVTIPHMAELFNCFVGLSDHTPGVGAALAAIALGATVVEKHFVLDRSEGGVDAAFSMEPEEFKTLVVEAKRAHESLGSVQYDIQKAEMTSLRFKRSIYVSRDLLAGTLLSEDNTRIVRPGMGLHPRFLPMILGKKVIKDVKKGTPLSFDLFG